MNEDHLDRETAISAELTETGIRASAKSRAIASLDRLLGSLAEWATVRLEAGTSRRRAQIEGERKIIDAVASFGIERLGYDRDFAQRAFDNHFQSTLIKQENKDGVARSALADLRRVPPTEVQANTGPSDVSPEFWQRFERYAEEATTEALRERWGRILASEIRSPGTFSLRVLRIVDELDSEVAALFERECQNGLAGDIPICLSAMTQSELSELHQAGLLLDAPLDFETQFHEMGGDESERVWIAQWDDLGLAFVANPNAKIGESVIDSSSPVVYSDGKPVLRIYALSNVGKSVATVLPDNRLSALRRLRDILTERVGVEFRPYRLTDDGRRWSPFEPEVQ